jgi:selenide,water dikinase
VISYVSGVEQARLLKDRRAAGKSPDLVKAVLITHTPTVLPSHNHIVRAKFKRILHDRGVVVYNKCHVVAVQGNMIVCENGPRIETDEVIWCTQASTQAWLLDSGLNLAEGFIAVDDCLQSVNTADVFAVGDVALMVNHHRPRAGVFAVRQGPPLAVNIRRLLVGDSLQPYVPQSDFLGIISSGSVDCCVASKGPMALEGAWLWQLKDWIDRKWMASYSSELPEMSAGMCTAAMYCCRDCVCLPV